tara:strand:- start:875 stop:1135 length:261 start_codon:yes stop_codon:yes gene_type:complete
MPQTNLTKARENAKKYNVEVKVSTVKNKKLDVYKKGDKVASIGDIRYGDFLQTGDKQKQKNYKSRHQKDRTKVGSAGYYADKILWT